MSRQAINKESARALTVAAFGVVFGDIGTSPLYTLKTVLTLAGGKPDQTVVLGTLSLILWTLIIVTTVKYVCFAMQFDNDGEGGILALMSLLGGKNKPRAAIVILGLVGAALIYGDGAVTPAISVLSAVEGLHMVAPAFSRYVLPTAVAILLGLFIIQRQGSARIGKAFGPIMCIWFLAIAALGVWGIMRHPAVLFALNPYYGFLFLRADGVRGFLTLGGVFLCVTGAEALYADIGHFGARPIRVAWSALVFPALLLNYAGQSALVLSGQSIEGSVFYRLCPPVLLIPMVILATVATIIASQSIITGAFSMTRQAIQLGWLPRLKIIQTSEEGYGQIYVGSVNWMLMVVTCGLALAFRKSDNLAAAYGIAVSATMLATSILLYFAMREIWGWGGLRAGAVAGIFVMIDLTFFSANSTKIASGGYVPLVLAAFVYISMAVWHRGARAAALGLRDGMLSTEEFLRLIAGKKIPRVPGTGVFLTRTDQEIPPVLRWHLTHNRSLHEVVLVLTVKSESIPRISAGHRLKVTKVAPNFWRVVGRFGFMERPNIPALLAQAHEKGCGLDLSDVTYYAGRGTILCREDRKGLPRWVALYFAAMERNSMHVGDYFRLPSEDTVEIGRQIHI
jgi:KUP system potassium uptake protein